MRSVLWWNPYHFPLGFISSAPFSTRHSTRLLSLHQVQQQRQEAQVVQERLNSAEAALWCVSASLTLPYLRVQRKTGSQKGEKNALDKGFSLLLYE
jgi:hypothetical protein